MQQRETQHSLTPLPLEQVLAILRTHRADLAARYHLSELGVFGSYVRGEQRQESDVDILVAFTVTPSLFTLSSLEDELRRLLNHPVDLVVKSALRPHIGAHVLREVVPV